MVPPANPPPSENAMPQNGAANPTPAIAAGPMAIPTKATSTAFFDIRAMPVTMRGHAKSVVRRTFFASTRPRRASTRPMERIVNRAGFGKRVSTQRVSIRN